MTQRTRPAERSARTLRSALATRSRRSAEACSWSAAPRAPSRSSSASSTAPRQSSCSARSMPPASTWRSRWMTAPRAARPRRGGRLSALCRRSPTSQKGASRATGLAASAMSRGGCGRPCTRATNSATRRLLPTPAPPMTARTARLSSARARSRARSMRSSSAVRPKNRPRRSCRARARSSKSRGPSSSSTRKRRLRRRRAGSSRKANCAEASRPVPPVKSGRCGSASRARERASSMASPRRRSARALRWAAMPARVARRSDGPPLPVGASGLARHLDRVERELHRAGDVVLARDLEAEDRHQAVGAVAVHQRAVLVGQLRDHAAELAARLALAAIGHHRGRDHPAVLDQRARRSVRLGVDVEIARGAGDVEGDARGRAGRQLGRRRSPRRPR